MPGAAKLQVPNICHGAGSQIDLSVPVTKLQREQAMVGNVCWLLILIFNFETDDNYTCLLCMSTIVKCTWISGNVGLPPNSLQDLRFLKQSY
jgi:hypothetical protein